MKNRVAKGWWRYKGWQGGNKLRGCFVNEGNRSEIVINVKGGKL